MNGSTWRIWRWPAALALLTLLGLLSALLGEGGLWWALSWIALALPLLVIAACVVRRQRISWRSTTGRT